MKTLHVPGAILAVLFFSQALQAQVTVSVVPSVGPNPIGSPNAGGYDANAVTSLYQSIGGSAAYLQSQTGITASAAAPANFANAGSVVSTSQIIGTPFNSWMGNANPTGAYANELGNNLFFSTVITSNHPGTTQFALNDVSYNITSTDPLHTLDDPGGMISGNYSDTRVGVLAGPDGILGTADDIFITSGPGTQLVDGLLLRGASTAYDSTSFSNQSGSNQDILSNGVAEIGAGGLFNITGNYSVAPGIGNASGSGSAQLGIVPEPSTVVVFSAGLMGLGFYIYRRRLWIGRAA
jgi:hypothetical protein